MAAFISVTSRSIGVSAESILDPLKEDFRVFICPLLFISYLGQISELLSSHFETSQQSLVINPEAPLTWCHVKVPVRSGQRERVVDSIKVGSRSTIVSRNQFPGLILDSLSFFCGKQDLEELLAVMPRGLMGK